MICALMRQTWFESANKHMTDLERLTFYEVCFKYEFYGEIPTEKTCKYGNVLMMFDMVKNDLQADREKADRIAERNRINGLQGGRPRKDNGTPQNNENPEKPKETQKNPVVTQPNPIHYTTLHNNTTAASSIGSGAGLDLDFFDDQLWPRLNRSGKYNTRHKICAVKWLEYSERKRKAITKAVLSDLFAGADNPFFYLEDFAEPAPKYLTGKECEEEWRAGRSVYVIQTPEGVFKNITGDDLREFGLQAVREMLPE